MKLKKRLTFIGKNTLLFLTFLCGTQLSWAENKNIEDPFGHITNPTPENLPTYSGTCDDLYPITSLNNLLTQIYRHLDDDCLYLMPTDQLSKKLGIAVVPYYDMETGKPIKDRYEELLQKPFTDLRSGIFLRKSVLVKHGGKSIEKLSLKEQRQRERKNFHTIGYDIEFSSTYLDKYPLPFYKDSPTLPKPNSFSKFSVVNNSRDAIEEEQWLKEYGIYSWYGYSRSKISFFNYSRGIFSFDFIKFFYLNEE